MLYASPWVTVAAHEIVHPNGSPGEHVEIQVGAACAPGESALDCARRETREVIGVEAARWDPLGVLFEVPSIIGGALTVYLGRDCTFVPARPDGVESIERVRMPFVRAVEQARWGGIDDAISAAAVLRAEAFLCRER